MAADVTTRRAAALAVVYALGFIHGSSWSAARPPRDATAPVDMEPAAAERASAGGAWPCAGGDGACAHAHANDLRGEQPARAGGGDGSGGGGEWDQAIGPAAAADDAAPRARRSSEKRVIAYSLYGDKRKYCAGALRNAELVGSVFPGWVARFYVDARTVPAGVLAGLRARGAEVVEVDTHGMRAQHMFWRFWVAADGTVDRFICRDVDSRLLARDYAAVREWISSGARFHFERDHPSHSNYPISGGLWGGTRHAAPDMLELIAAYPTDANYLSDMNFLNERIWPRAQHASLQHDAFSCEQFGARPFPLARSAAGEHVGQVFEEDGRPRQADVQLLLDASAPAACRHPDDAPTPGNRRADAAAVAGRSAQRAPMRLHARGRCRELQERHAIVPGSSWGDAPPSAQAEWASFKCDAALAAAAARASALTSGDAVRAPQR